MKIHVSGGVTSPWDPMWMPQFCEEEVRVAVTEELLVRAAPM